LGLAIVKQVVVKHGGTLRVEDTVPGGQPPGTSMHVVLPGRPLPSTRSVGMDAPVVSADNA
jgi:two-component system sensor histidine kinase MprB